MDSGFLYTSENKTLFIPDCIISLEHSKHGDNVTYSVELLELCVPLANFVIAFASACRTYGKVSFVSDSHTFGNPDGDPL